MGVIRFNGISSADFGCTIERRPNHTRGSRRGELIEVPGRNGVAVLEDGSFTTYKQEYVMAFKEGDTMPPYKRAAQVAEWLLGSRGFCRLEDDFEPNVYRMARYAGALNIEQVADKYGQVVLEFECQPQRYLKSGEMEIKYTRFSGQSGYGADIEVTNLPQNATRVRMVARYEGTETPDGALFVLNTESEQTSVEMNVEQTEEGYQLVGETDIQSGIFGILAHYAITQGNDKDATLTVYGENSEEILAIVSFIETFAVYNNTMFESRPLLKFTGSPREQPAPVSQTLTMRKGYKINKYGGIGKTTATESNRYSVSNAVNVSGYKYAYITGAGYAFLNSNNVVIRYVETDRAKLNNTKIAIPSGADSVVVATGIATSSAALSLQGTVAVGVESSTINGTTITLDYSTNNTIYLNTDLHDAYYEDGSNANSAVSFSSNLTDYPTFPGFEPGENVISVPGTDSVEVVIIPRWWTL